MSMFDPVFLKSFYIMNLWVTEIEAIDPMDGHMKLWAGPHVPGDTFADAVEYCIENGLGYCKVVDQLCMEIEADENGNPDFNSITIYDQPNSHLN
jgi:hypothetical protein